jgi:DnaJ family protein A protein 2
MKVIHGQGMPSKRHHEPGDLYVKFHITFPDEINPAVIPLLEQALPLRKGPEQFGSRIALEEAYMDSVDARSRTRAQRMDDGEPMEEDGDGGEARMQCANQ